jgi:endonuclease/exonuclease/phosphatase family metal-dependent hydrolase
VEVRRVELPRTRRSLIASDHLPLVADVRISF